MITDDRYFCLGIVKGIAGVYIISDEGREILLMKLGPASEGILSTSILIKHLDQDIISFAETDCELLMIRTDCFKKLIDSNIALRCYWYELVANSMSSAVMTMKSTLFVSIDKRIAGYLIETCDEYGATTILITHEELAKNIHSVREVVARVLSRFSKQGIISTSRGKICIKDEERLREIIA